MQFRPVGLATLLALAAAVPAAAQAPPQMPAPPAGLQALSLSVQQINNSARMFVEEVQRSLDAKDAVIAELKEKCGDVCKPPQNAVPAPVKPGAAPTP